MYTEYKPSSIMSRYVEVYWISEATIVQPQTIRILPDGCVDILFNLGDPNSFNSLKQFVPYVIGAMTVFSEKTYTVKVHMLGVRFRPGGITAFMSTPINHFTDTIVDMALTQSLFDPEFCDVLAAQKSDRERLLHLDQFLIRKLPITVNSDSRVLHSIALIEKSKGLIPIAEIAATVCLCQRQLERNFKAVVGYSPKMFSRITKFKNAQLVLKQHPKANLFTTALECGYYDHAHLIKDFKQFSGVSPSTYQK